MPRSWLRCLRSATNPNLGLSLGVGEFDIVTVPSDPVVISADRQGISPIDLDAAAPAVSAIGALVDQLTA